MIRTKIFGLALLGLNVSLLLANCAKPPEQEMEEAREAIQAAKAVEAERYAAKDLQAAQDTFAYAQGKVEDKDYKAAKQLALLAKQKADSAKISAEKKRAEAKADAEEALSKAQTAMLAAKVAVDNAAALGVPKTNIVQVRRALAILDTSLANLQAAFEEGDFLEVVKRAEEVEGKVRKAALKADPNDPNEVAVIQTEMGRIVFDFFLKDAPNHVANFKKLAKVGFYNGTTFHRVIPKFMIQGGDPNSKDDDRSNDGMGGPGYTIDAEFNDRPHLRGTVSMARSRDPNSAGSQFFICITPQPRLDRQYTAFGQVMEGMEVVDKIVQVPRDSKDNPLEKVEMKVSIVDRGVLSLR